MTPLILISGFLGAGKTTLLKALLPQLVGQGVRPHVVLNDYMNARVDAATLGEYTRLVTPITGTCVCCGSQDELIDSLVIAEKTPESIALLEANGTADTSQLIEILSAKQALSGYSLPIQINVIDGKRWQKRHWHNKLERSQVETAGYLYITRKEQVSPERYDQVEIETRVLAPRAQVVVNPEDIAAALVDLVRDVPNLPPRRFHAGQKGDLDKEAHHHHTNGHHHHHHGHQHTAHHFACLELPLPPNLTRQALQTFLEKLPPEVLRAKGIAAFQDEEQPVYFQRTDTIDGITMQRLMIREVLDNVAVLIGLDLDHDTYTNMLHDSIAKASALHDNALFYGQTQ
jgi:G3E family GTPase